MTKRLDIQTALMFGCLLLAPAICHLAFSWMGHNPTDDGFVLAQSRRILDGQLPHRDFISVRPAASALLHAPSVFFGGDRTYWWSRGFVWFEFSCIAWAWVLLTQRTLGNPFRNFELPLIHVIAFVLTAHSFPLMAWHSIDAVFFVSLGLLGATHPRPRWKWLGYGLIGVACLCRQNFLVVALMAPLLLGDWRRLGSWIAILVPGTLYLAVMAAHGSLGEFTHQLGSGSIEDVLHLGVWRLLTEPLVYGGLALGAIAIKLCQARVSSGTPPRRLAVLLGLGFLYAVIGVLGWKMATQPRHFLWGTAGLLGLHAGAILYLAFTGRWKIIPIGLMALLVAWSVSISYGYNHPALMAGPLAILVLGFALHEAADFRWRGVCWIHLALAAALIFAFAQTRSTFIYRDRVAGKLNHSLGALLPGAKNIYTNARTHALFADLKLAIAKVKDYDYVIVPDFPGYFVKSERPNPTSGVWFNHRDVGFGGFGEIGTDDAFKRLLAEFAENRDRWRWIVSKYRTDYVMRDWVPFRTSPRRHQLDMTGYLRKNFELIGETKYFQIYR